MQSLKTLGLMPFETDGKSVVISKFGCARFAAVLFIQICTYSSLLRQTLQWHKFDTRTLGQIATFFSLTCTYAAIFGTVHQLVSTKQRARLSKFICALDSCLKVFPFSSTATSVFRYAHIKLQIIILILFTISYFKVSYDCFIKREYFILTYGANCWFSQFYLAYLTVPFLCFLNVIEQNLKSMNRSICKAHAPNEVAKFVRVYDRLSFAVEQLNRFYGFTLLCCINAEFLNIINSLFYAITNGVWYTSDLYRDLVNFATSMSNASCIYSLAKSCDSVANKVSTILYHLGRKRHECVNSFHLKPLI